MNVVLFDKSYSREKTLEGLGVNHAIITGKCDKCEYLPECETNSNFVFPCDAACMVYADSLN